jgi:FAD/FMN-containing dehydrogenase
MNHPALDEPFPSAQHPGNMSISVTDAILSLDKEATMSSTLSRDSVEGLRQQFSGEVVGPDDAGYDERRAVHNGLVDKRPALIARCANTADIADAVRFARAEGLEISTRGGGHNVAGKAVTDGGIMIDLASMRGSYVDPTKRRARVQGGATWNDYNRATYQHRLATTGGVVSTTGVAGLTLGGGFGWLMGRFGMAVDNLQSVELVTADGDVLQVSAETNPDLLWGLRGGGGNFGIAASLEFDAHPVDTVLGGLVAYPLSEAMPAFAAYQDVTADDPDELTAFFVLVHAPDGSGNKIVALPVCHSGDLPTGEALVAPLRAVGPPAVDMIGPMPYPVVNTMLDAGFPKRARNYWKSAFLKELSEEVIGLLVDAFQRVPSPMTAIILERYHGAVTRVDPTETAFPHREPGFNLALAGEWMDPGEDGHNMEWVRSTFDALRPHTTDAVYVNYIAADEPERIRAAYGPNWERLVALKRRWDPDNVFHLNQNIDPSG